MSRRQPPREIAGTWTRAQAIDRLAAEIAAHEIEAQRQLGRSSTQDTIDAHARAQATRLVDEAIAGASGGVVDVTIGPGGNN